MTDLLESLPNDMNGPQCQFFVIRKKRLCRMTVKPGRQYCGEHEPQPKTDNGEMDTRIPCPNDPKHTCYASKLEKHLLICNARQGDVPPYIIHNINAPATVDVCPRQPLSEISRETLMQVIDKVNLLFDKHVIDNMAPVSEQPIHHTILQEFNECNRSESSRRHLRQTSSLLQLAESQGLVADRTCYVELGAGKGQLSYYACCAWCTSQTTSRVLLVDRASLRHKRDNKLRHNATLRLRADLAHLALHRVPIARECDAVVGFAKHLCGVATDYALRCITAEGVLEKTRGVVLATCCHHRCEHSGYVANKQIQELGITGEDLNAMLGIVSWATCGDGRSRERRRRVIKNNQGEFSEVETSGSLEDSEESFDQNNIQSGSKEQFTQQYRELVGRKAKALLDWGRVLYLREKGFDASLCYYVPTSVSLENVCIVAKKTDCP